MKRLGVNIDHVATLRNARGELHPNPVNAANFIKKKGINSVTIHLREDRRHIKDIDAKRFSDNPNDFDYHQLSDWEVNAIKNNNVNNHFCKFHNILMSF